MSRLASPPDPLVVLLGAASWPAWPLMDNPVFQRSSDAFADFLQSGLGIPSNNILNLFGSDASPNDLVHEIQQFLCGPDSSGCTDVIVYYVGHGDRIPDTTEFTLLTACASPDSTNSSSFHSSYLLEATREAGRKRRTHILMDACFSATATDAFKQPVGNEGVSLLASASRSDRSSAPQDADATVFTQALLSVLRRGDPEHGTMFSLRDLKDRMALEIKDIVGSDDLAPELHSPHQRRGDAAVVGVFRNLAHAYVRTPATSESGRPWCAVISTSDGHGERRDVFAGALVEFIDMYRGRIMRETGWDLQEKPTNILAAEVFESPRSLQDAVASVCAADLAFFDLTGLEPAVLFLLGVRAVIRRGVSICSTSSDPDGERATVPPFLLRDINVFSHSSPAEVPEKLLGSRAIAGIQELSRAPHRYADLPGFDVVRPLPRALENRTIIPYEERVLVLCSFNHAYEGENWPEIRRRLANAITGRTASGQAEADAKPEVRIERTLDMGSPRVVSANLLEAIRSTDMCLCDLTGWKPNVFFELGLRMAANPVDPICIINGEIDTEDETPPGIARQRAGVVNLLDVMQYDPTRRDDYLEMIDRHLEVRRTIRETSGAVPAQSGLPTGSLYRVAWQYANPDHEPTAIDVVDLLRDSAAELRSDRSRGSTPFIFPVAHILTEDARRNATERLVAAWLYLRHRQGTRGQSNDGHHEGLKQVGIQLLELLADSMDEADLQLSTEVWESIQDPALQEKRGQK